MRTKILVATIMVVGFFMGLSLYKSLVIHKETAMNQVASSSDHLLESIYSGIKFPMSVGDCKTIREQMKDIKHHMEGVQVYISDFQNMIMYASEDERIYKSMATYLYENKSRDALAESLLTGQAPDISFSETENHTPYLITIKPILNENSCRHCHGSTRKVLGAMIIKQPVKEVFHAISHARNSLIIYFTAAIIGVIVVVEEPCWRRSFCQRYFYRLQSLCRLYADACSAYIRVHVGPDEAEIGCQRSDIRNQSSDVRQAESGCAGCGKLVFP